MGLALAACGSSTPNGMMSGTARIQEGGPQVLTVAGHAKITLRQGDRLVTSTTVTSGRKFVVSAPAGSYQIGMRCPKRLHDVSGATDTIDSAPVTVVPNRISHVDLQCFINAGGG
jgi:hypothetical protein